MKHLFVTAFLLGAATGATAFTAPPSGPTDPNQDPKNTAVFKDTDGTCYSRNFKDFGKVVPCPPKKP